MSVDFEDDFEGVTHDWTPESESAMDRARKEFFDNGRWELHCEEEAPFAYGCKIRGFDDIRFKSLTVILRPDEDGTFSVCVSDDDGYYGSDETFYTEEEAMEAAWELFCDAVAQNAICEALQCDHSDGCGE